jgi:hypothetical protein
VRVSDIKRDCAGELDVGGVTGVLVGDGTREGEGIRWRGMLDESLGGTWNTLLKSRLWGFRGGRGGGETRGVIVVDDPPRGLVSAESAAV